MKTHAVVFFDRSVQVGQVPHRVLETIRLFDHEAVHDLCTADDGGDLLSVLLQVARLVVPLDEVINVRDGARVQPELHGVWIQTSDGDCGRQRTF